MGEREDGEELESSIERSIAELRRKMAEPEDAEKLEALIERLLDDNQEARYEVAREIGSHGRWVMPRANTLADDPRPRMREMAAYILGQVGYPDPASPGFLIRYPDGIATLLRLLERDPDEEVRTNAAYALGFLKAPATIPILVRVADDPCPEVREAVATALGSFHATYYWSAKLQQRYLDELRSTLLRLMDDEDDDVRDWATFGIHQGGHDTPATRARLWQALDDPHFVVRGEAAAGLAQFGDRSLIPRLETLLREDPKCSTLYFEAARDLRDPCLLPAVLAGAERWRETLKEGEELDSRITWAIEALQEAAVGEAGEAREPSPGEE
jgi:HEAT repeat protein